jgi:hypothetical protein
MSLDDVIARLRGELDTAYDAADATLDDGELALQIGRFSILEATVRKMQKVLYDKACRIGVQPRQQKEEGT